MSRTSRTSRPRRTRQSWRTRRTWRTWTKDNRDRGSISAEYAIAVGFAAGLVVLVMTAYRQQILHVISNWDFF